MARTGRPPVAPIVRFVAFVAPEGDCWIWTGTTDRVGYGTFWDGARQVKAHRWSYEHHRAEIPEGLQLDHLCRTPSCVNPWHLEPVTPRVNTRRGTSPIAANATKTHCKHGHEFTPANTAVVPGGRKCIECRRRIGRESMRRKASA